MCAVGAACVQEVVLRVEYHPSLGQPTESEGVPHPDWVGSVAGIDGSYVSGCYDGIVRVFDAGSTVAVAESSVHGAAVTAVHLMRTSAETVVASGSKDCSLRLSAVVDGAAGAGGDRRVLRCFATASGIESAVTAVCFSPSSVLVAASCWDGSVSLWNVGDAMAAGDAVLAAASSSAAATAAAAASKKRRRRGSAVEEGAEAAAAVAPVDMPVVTRIPGGSLCASAVAWQGDARLVVGGYDHAVHVYDVEREGRLELSVVRGAVPCCAAPCRVVLCSHAPSCTSGNLALTLASALLVTALVVAARCRPVRHSPVRVGFVMQCGNKVVTALCTPVHGSTVVTGHPDNVLRVWDTRSGSANAVAKATLSGHDAWVSSVSWSPASSHLVSSASHDGSVQLWDVRGTKALSVLGKHDDKALAVAFVGSTHIVSGEHAARRRPSLLLLSDTDVCGASLCLARAGGADSKLKVFEQAASGAGDGEGDGV